jgi:outer membrane protein assembly complex protein YaeT
MSRCSGKMAVVLALAVALTSGTAFAVSLDALDPGRTWRLGRVRIEGNRAIGKREIRRTMLLETRPWYAVWRRPPFFDPVTLETDVERVVLLYRRQGHYRARVDYDIHVPDDGDALTVVVTVAEGPVVMVERVDVTLRGAELAPRARARLLRRLPIAAGQPFTEASYDAAVTHLLQFYRERGYARAAVTKKATVDVRATAGVVSYDVDSGPRCFFGDVTIAGAEDVAPDVVRREVVFRSGQPFRAALLDETRENLVGLHLFRTVSIVEGGEGERVDVVIRVIEQPPREVTLGVGFDSEELVRGFASWRHFNFLGGARQLGVSVRASLLERTIGATFLQPHFPVHDARTALLFSQAQEDEDPFTLDRTRVSPRIEWRLRSPYGIFVAHRFEYNTLTEVKNAVVDAFPGIAPKHSVLSGVVLGTEWTNIDDPLEPTRGAAATATVEPVGDFLGGDVSFVRLTWEGRVYGRLPGKLVGTARLRLGAADPLASSQEVPYYERFFAGGIDSVRGYDRWRVGPLIRDTPVGGRTRVEWSLEVRRPITERVAAAVFLDAGQVSVRSYDFPFGDLRYGAGIGGRYRSPIGPIGVDLGIPNDPPADDQPWRVHVNLGGTF